MANNLSLVKIVCVTMMCMVVFAPHAEAAISCGSVVGALTPCVNYLKGMGPLPANCCGGVRSLVGAARTTPDRQTACNCLKSLAGRLNGLKPSLASGLPGKCGVNVGYPISTSTDCSRVH